MAERIPVLIACSGLSHVQRGYEVSLQGAFDELRERPELDLHLCKGSGPRAPREHRVPVIKRSAPVAGWVARLTRGSPYVVEQATFMPGLLRVIRGFERPPVVLHSDWQVSFWLSRWRRRAGAPCVLLYRNGGPNPPPFHHVDHVMQISPEDMRLAMEAGEPSEKHTLLPTAMHIPRALRRPAPDELAPLRARLDLPAETPVALSVAALNATHKRLDYVIREVARMESPPFLLLLGHRNWETPKIEQLAAELLPPTGYAIRTEPPERLPDYYAAADLFLLASFREGLPRSVIEAMAAGLPCVLHDWEVPRYVAGEHGLYGDFARDGQLAAVLADAVRRLPALSETAAARHAEVYDRFSWDALAPRYVELFRRCSDGSRHAQSTPADSPVRSGGRSSRSSVA
jgi:1,2-diacylglycerol 3-alpha-glucosyltransferase